MTLSGKSAAASAAVLPPNGMVSQAANQILPKSSWFPARFQEKADMAKKAASPATVTLKQLAAEIADGQDMSKKQAEIILTDLVTRIARHLKKGERIRIVGLGILRVRKRAARMGRNPATGEPVPIKASKKVAFRPAKELAEAV